MKTTTVTEHIALEQLSRKYGVAKRSTVIAVKVLRSNGTGTMSNVIAGIVWASNEAARNAARARAEYAATGNTAHKGSVANMSLGGGRSRALEDTVNSAVEQGIHFTVAAGNDYGDACESSPAAAKNVTKFSFLSPVLTLACRPLLLERLPGMTNVLISATQGNA
jgi:cerevisin